MPKKSLETVKTLGGKPDTEQEYEVEEGRILQIQHSNYLCDTFWVQKNPTWCKPGFENFL